jgi:hypothetical protein
MNAKEVPATIKLIVQNHSQRFISAPPPQSAVAGCGETVAF